MEVFCNIDQDFYRAIGADEIAKLKSFDCWCNGDKDLWVKITNTHGNNRKTLHIGIQSREDLCHRPAVVGRKHGTKSYS